MPTDLHIVRGPLNVIAAIASPATMSDWINMPKIGTGSDQIAMPTNASLHANMCPPVSRIRSGRLQLTTATRATSCIGAETATLGLANPMLN